MFTEALQASQGVFAQDSAQGIQELALIVIISAHI